MTECFTYAMRIEHGTGYEIHHPLQALEAALTDADPRGGRDADGVDGAPGTARTVKLRPPKRVVWSAR